MFELMFTRHRFLFIDLNIKLNVFIKQVLHDTVNWQFCDLKFIVLCKTQKLCQQSVTTNCGIRASLNFFSSLLVIEFGSQR